MYNTEEVVVTRCLCSDGTNALVVVIRRLAVVVGSNVYAIVILLFSMIVDIMIKQFIGKYFIIVDNTYSFLIK